MTSYNERRKLPDYCSSCGKHIGAGHSPRLCETCNSRVSKKKSNKPSNDTDKRVKPLTFKLKTYKVPTEPWKLYLYNEYKLVGMSTLSNEIGVKERTLTNHIFTKARPIGDNYNALLEHFRIAGRNDLVYNLQSYTL